MRSQKSYDPPQDSDSKVTNLCKSLNISQDDKTVLKGSQKYELLSKCSSAFNHSVPNSLLHEIETIGKTI